MGKEFFCRSFFHHLSQVHNGNIIGKIVDYGEIMGNKDIGQPHFPLKFFQKI